MSSMYIIVYANYKSNDNVNTYDDRHDRELVEFTKFINFEGVEDVLLYCYMPSAYVRSSMFLNYTAFNIFDDN